VFTRSLFLDKGLLRAVCLNVVHIVSKNVEPHLKGIPPLLTYRNLHNHLAFTRRQALPLTPFPGRIAAPTAIRPGVYRLFKRSAVR
jgi:hypothetical protein